MFTRKEYRDIVLDSIRYCQSEKGLALHSWCLMSNNLHLVVSAKNENLSDILRDFKKFTSKQIIEAIINNKHESRKIGCCKFVKRKGVKTVVIQHINSGVRITNLSPKFVFQKINYIHNNPVESGIVEKAEDYLYSSAKDYHATKKCGLLDLEFL